MIKCHWPKPRRIAIFEVILTAVLPLTANGQRNIASIRTGSQAKHTTARIFAFEVASIKPYKGSDSNGWWKTLPNGLSALNIPIQSLIMGAYGLATPSQISGLPKWGMSARFDVEAKMDEDTTAALHKLPMGQQLAKRQLMLQSLLVDRFNLKVHRETKILPIYELVIAKVGFKLKECNPGSTCPSGPQVLKAGPRVAMMMTGPGELTAYAATISRLAAMLCGFLHRSVVDKTGLSGKYAFTLTWSPDEMAGAGPLMKGISGPSIFTALQEQLGLKLKSAKAPTDVIVIDHVEKPSAN